MERRLHHLLRDERGTSIIEVVVAAAILLLASGAVIQLITTAGTQSGQQRVAAVGADLAQSQLEELRAQKFATLLALPTGTTGVTHGGQEFSVQKTAEWAMESPPGAFDCTTSGRRPEALKVSVTVTWPNMSRKPITIDSLVAAPPGARAQRGSHVVQITDRNNAGVPGITVQFQGTPSLSRATDADGCVRFHNVPAGPYTIGFQKTGYVDRSNQNVIAKDVVVVEGETGSSQFDYDLAGSAKASFIARTGATTATGPTAVAGARFVNSGVTVNGTLNVAKTEATTPNAWPAADAYSVFADTCTLGSPVGQITMVPGTQATATFTLPRIRLTFEDADENVPASMYRVRAKSACGTQSDATGGTLVNTGKKNQPNWVYTSEWMVVPPGTLPTVCIWAQVGTTYYWGAESNVALAASDIAGKTHTMSTGTVESGTNLASVCT